MSNSKTGVELIAQERQEQIEKHGRTVENDVMLNHGTHCNSYGQVVHEPQLIQASLQLLKSIDTKSELRIYRPFGWDRGQWHKMVTKPDIEKLTIIGALIAAEIDRLQFINPQTPEF